MSTTEIPLIFNIEDQPVVGIVHQANSREDTGVLIIVGGPQYRVGSHRQFVLLARYLANHGFSAMRFDVRGMGDSTGESRQFDQIDQDIKDAIDAFLNVCPSLKRVVIWGLCDAASAALFYGYQDSRVAGLVLLNPWVFTQQGAAKTFLKHYYLERLCSRDLWRKIFTLNFDFWGSLLSLVHFVKQVMVKKEDRQPASESLLVDRDLPLPIRMRECTKRFTKPILIILSGRDLTASEFKETVKNDSEWQSLISNPLVTRHDFPEADHTFSSAPWRNQVADWTLNWVVRICG